MKKMTIDVKCICCSTVKQIEVNEKDYTAWKTDTNIQDAMPYLSADDRELLISKICPTCWDTMFPPEEEEEDHDE